MTLHRTFWALAVGSLIPVASLQAPARAIVRDARATSGISRLQDEKIEELRKLRRERRQKESEIAALSKAPRGDADTVKKIEALQAALQPLKDSIQKLTPEVVQDCLKTLKEGAPEAVKQATYRLAEVGTPAVQNLDALVSSGTPDEQSRAKAVLRLIKEVEADDTGIWKQWASGATASSEYQEDQWCAEQACGEPDTEVAGDRPTAWASLEPDGGEEWLELTYKHAVRPTLIRIHETFNPGAVIKIEAKDADKKWQILWQGKDTVEEAPAYFEVRIDPPKFAVRAIRITIDSGGVEGWNEIDAVQLIGEYAETPAKK